MPIVRKLLDQQILFLDGKEARYDQLEEIHREKHVIKEFEMKCPLSCNYTSNNDSIYNFFDKSGNHFNDCPNAFVRCCPKSYINPLESKCEKVFVRKELEKQRKDC